MLGPVDLGRAQITDQQPLAAEHIQRQETVMIVVAVEETAFLAPVHRIVGGVEVEDEFLGRLRMRRDEALHQGLVDTPRPVPPSGVLEAAQRRRAGQGTVPLGRRLQGEIVAKGRVVVDVLVAQRQPEHPLAQHGGKMMRHLALLPDIDQPPRNASRQTRKPVRLTKQQDPAVAGDVATREISLYTPLPARWKFDLRKGTIRHRQIPVFEST